MAARLFRLLLTATAAVLFAACDGAPTADPPADSADDAEVTASSPAMEGTGPEPPRTGGDGGPSLTLPRLPVGGAGGGEERVCALPALTAELPDGVSVAVTGVGFTDPGVFTVDGSSCDGVRGCTESFVFPADGTTCSVPVRAVESASGSTGLTLSGELRCAPENAQRCQDFFENSSPSSFQLSHPNPPPEEEPEEESEQESPPPEESPAPEESDAPATTS